MTDEQIIKALGTCGEIKYSCGICPYIEKYGGVNCNDALCLDALDLINRQKAEIERLQNTLDDVLDRQPLLVERAEKYAKTEAYKELAEELKGYCSDIDTDNINEPTVRILWDAEDTIDNVVKELMEESK